MGRFLLRRLLHGLMVVAFVATIVFVLIHLAPGDPFSTTLDSPTLSPAIRERWIAQHGLDKPLPEQYVRYLWRLAHGDMGWSLSLHRPVDQVLRDALPNTLVLTSIALVLGFGIGIGIGVFQARRADTRTDRALTWTTMTVAGLPDFWIALLVMLTFSHWIPILPTSGAVDPVLHDYLGFWGRLGDRVTHLVLPVSTLALLISASVARYQRADLLRVLPGQFVQAARARGLSERRVLFRHALRNALIPIATLLGLSIPLAFTGALFIEKIFAWPGMGSITINAVFARDYPLVTAGVIVTSATVVVGSIVADLLYAWLDPRATRG